VAAEALSAAVAATVRRGIPRLDRAAAVFIRHGARHHPGRTQAILVSVLLLLVALLTLGGTWINR
jgi:hypothetical protein